MKSAFGARGLGLVLLCIGLGGLYWHYTTFSGRIRDVAAISDARLVIIAGSWCLTLVGAGMLVFAFVANRNKKEKSLWSAHATDQSETPSFDFLKDSSRAAPQSPRPRKQP
jgi:hypothetical protein